MRKVAITGHTSGIGQNLFASLNELGFTVSGFSRSNGFDISSADQQSRLITSILDYDIFINCAYYKWAQTEILFNLFSQWQDLNKHIINISSNSGDGTKSFIHPYAVHKASLDKASQQLNNIKGAKCKVTTIRPGWVNTPSVSHLETKEAQLKMSELTQTLVWLLDLPQHIHIPAIDIQAR